MVHKLLAPVIILVISILNPVVKSQATARSTNPVFLAPVPFMFNVSELQFRAYDVGKFDATRSYLLLPCFSIITETDTFRMPACTYTDNEVIYLVNTLDYERKKKYELEISAVDFFNNSLRTTKMLTINVINENDERPQFQNNNLELPRIKEDTKVSTTLPTLISVKDIDEEANNNNLTVKCDVTFQSSCTYFEVIQSNRPNKKDWKGHLALKRSLNLKDYRIKLMATDGKYTSSVVFTIPVEDINNHAPTFNDVASLIAINEETAIGSDISPVIVVEDEDKDEGYLEVTCYAETKGPMSPCDVFHIKKLSSSTNNKWFGFIILNKKLDYETSDTKFMFQLLAKDGKNENKYDITILLEDSNDEPPSFVPTREWRIKEDAKINSVLEGFLEVSDIDKTPAFSNVQLTCDTANGREYVISCSTFKITNLIRLNKTNTWRAELKLARKLDYETHKVYSIRFRATDGKSNSYLERKIYVVDVNDNRPFFNISLYNATLPMSTPVNSVFKPYIVASDVDPGKKLLTISCVPIENNQSANSTCEMFGVKTIRANTSYWYGQLELLKSLIYDELQPIYYVNLTAYDGIFTSKPTTVAVTVEPIPTYLSYSPSNPELNQNVTVRCDFAFTGGFNETTIEVLRANLSVLRYSPETKTPTLFNNSEAARLKNIKYMQTGRHGYISFTINTKSCHENNITCRTRDNEGTLHSVSQDLLTHSFSPSVEIKRGSCEHLKPKNAQLVCKGKSQEMTTTLKWYLTTDEGDYKELIGVQTTEVRPKYDYTKCFYVQYSTIVLDYKGKRRNAKCVLFSNVGNREVEVAKSVFNVGFEVPPEKLKFSTKCTGIVKDAVKIVCYGNVGNPAGDLRIFVVNESNSRTYEIKKQELEFKKPEFVNSSCVYFSSVTYTHTKNPRSTTRFICKTQVLIDDRIHQQETEFTVRPSDFCNTKKPPNGQATQQVVHSAFILLLLFWITFFT